MRLTLQNGELHFLSLLLISAFLLDPKLDERGLQLCISPCHIV